MGGGNPRGCRVGRLRNILRSSTTVHASAAAHRPTPGDGTARRRAHSTGCSTQRDVFCWYRATGAPHPIRSTGRERLQCSADAWRPFRRRLLPFGSIAGTSGITRTEAYRRCAPCAHQLSVHHHKLESIPRRRDPDVPVYRWKHHRQGQAGSHTVRLAHRNHTTSLTQFVFGPHCPLFDRILQVIERLFVDLV
jgi:hypothetical protein